MKVRGCGAAALAKLALEFAVLTAARSGEARGATWDEIDMEARTWAIPASRMKAGKAHNVPLSARAMAILESARAYGDSGLVFPSVKLGRPMDAETLVDILRRLELVDVNEKPATVHGMRSAFRDWAGETGKPRELAEAALAHAVGGRVERAYARSDLLDRRRALMDQWAAYLAG